MSWSSIGKTIAEYAPLLGGVVGGPAGAGIGSLIASAFGVEDKPDAILKAIKADPEAAIKLKELEVTHKYDLERIKLREAEAYLDDTQNARGMYGKHNEQADNIAHSIITFNIMYVVAVALAQILAITMTDLPDAAIVVIGNVCGWIIKGLLDERLQVCGFYFGSSLGSKSKK